jgi:hypothetical protein
MSVSLDQFFVDWCWSGHVVHFPLVLIVGLQCVNPNLVDSPMGATYACAAEELDSV